MKLSCLIVVLFLSMVTALLLGQVRILELGADSWNILWDFRLPRVLFAAINGAILAVAGVLYQLTLRNPMADGFTTGAASSAAFGGCLALVLWGHLLWASLLAIFFSGLGILLVLQVSRKTGDSARVTIILAGIALSVVAGAGISFLKYFFEESLGTIIFWLMGGLAGATFGKIGILVTVFTGSMVFLLCNKNRLAILFLDDLSAESSGVNVNAMRKLLFVTTTILVAISVSFCGVIGFLGLMIPHAVRALMGHSITTQLVGSSLMGATALVLFDLLSRVVLPYGGELPVGIITSVAGGGFFFILLTRKGGSIWRK